MSKLDYISMQHLLNWMSFSLGISSVICFTLEGVKLQYSCDLPPVSVKTLQNKNMNYLVESQVLVATFEKLTAEIFLSLITFYLC